MGYADHKSGDWLRDGILGDNICGKEREILCEAVADETANCLIGLRSTKKGEDPKSINVEWGLGFDVFQRWEIHGKKPRGENVRSASLRSKKGSDPGPLV